MTVQKNLDVIVMTAGGGIRAKSLLRDTLESFRDMVRFTGTVRFLVHDDPLYLRSIGAEATGWTGKVAKFEEDACLDFRQWLSANAQRLKIAKVVYSDEWQHIGGSIKALLPHVETPVYFHLEGDFVFLREVLLDDALRCFADPQVNMICFSQYWNDAEGLDAPFEPVTIEGTPLVAIGSWTFNPSLVRTSKMREFEQRSYVRSQHASEVLLLQAYERAIAESGFQVAHCQWGAYAYGRLGDAPVVEHIGHTTVDEFPLPAVASVEVCGRAVEAVVTRLLPSGHFKILRLRSDCTGAGVPGCKIEILDGCSRHATAAALANLDECLPFGDKVVYALVGVAPPGGDQAWWFMRECARVIQDDGFIILTLQDPGWSKRRRPILPVGLGAGAEKPDPFDEVRPIFARQWQRICSDIGLSLVHKTFVKDGTVVVKAVRRRSSRRPRGDRPEFLPPSPYRCASQRLSTGWILASEPLQSGKAKLALDRYLDGRRQLRHYATVKVRLKGARATWRYSVGVNVYGGDLPVFGRARRSRAVHVTAAPSGKQPVNSFLLGTLATNVRRKGHFEVGFPVDPGTYDVQVWVAQDAEGRAVCYQGGSGFGDSLVLTTAATHEARPVVPASPSASSAG